MDAVASRRAVPREWLGLAVLALPCLIYSMDLTVLDLALPSLAASLRPTGVELLWIVDIYGFFVAASLVTLGALGDRFGRRRVLLVGASLFAGTSVLAASATAPLTMIAARALMGFAGASLAPSTLALIRSLFRDPGQRTTAVGIWIASYSLGAALGPLVGGVVLAHFHWGAVFLLAVPVMLLLLLAGPHLLPEVRNPAAARVDVVSILLSLLGVLSAVHGTKELAVAGPSLGALAALGAGAALGALFVRRQRQLAVPLVDLAMFRRPALAGAFVAYALASFASMSVYLFIAQFLQLVAGLGPLRAGLWTVPFALTFTLGSSLTPPLARRVPRRPLMVGGLVVAAAGFALLLGVDAGHWRAPLLAGFVVFALGLSPVCVLAPDVIVSSAPSERAGSAAALTETAAELGGALGIALLGSLGTSIYRAELGARVLAGPAASALERARDSLLGAASAAAELPTLVGRELLETARAAYVHALHAVAWAACIVTLLSALALWRALRGASADP